MNQITPLSMRMVRRWARLYTRGLPDEARERRRLELESDMWEHLHESGEPAAARELFGRFLRGIPADVRWRYRTLLEWRGARPRSHVMPSTIRSNWWVILTAALGAVLVTMSVGLAAFGPGDHNSFRLVGTVVGVVTGGLVLAGLVKRRTDYVTGSQMIFAGSALTLFGGFELIPIGAIVVISGFWTGNLRLSDTADEPELRPVARPVNQQQEELVRHWYIWLAGAAVLFGIGWIPLLIEGGDLSWGYFIWVLSWFGAIVAGGVGVILAGLRLVVRHRTRLA